MLNEDNGFSFSQIRRGLSTRYPTLHLGRNPPSPDQPVYVGLGDIGAFPGGSGGLHRNSFLYRFDYLEVGVVRHVSKGSRRSEKWVTSGEINFITEKGN